MFEQFQPSWISSVLSAVLGYLESGILPVLPDVFGFLVIAMVFVIAHLKFRSYSVPTGRKGRYDPSIL